MRPYTYLLVNFTCILIPVIASFYRKYPFYKDWKAFFKGNVIVTFLFLIWDWYFTNIGVWGFNSDYLLRINIADLPIEEILFFICIPFACVFTYFALNSLIAKNPLNTIQAKITTILIIVFTIVAVLNFEKLYTLSAFGLCSLYLIYLKLKKVDLAFHYLTYLCILPFFFASNGILTGSLLDAPIVWYNNSENLGIRIATIPIEDSVYGMLLIFLNIECYRYFKTKNIQNTQHAIT